MNLQLVQNLKVLPGKICKNLVLTNDGASEDCAVMLPGLKEAILGPICFIGVEPHDVAFEAVEIDSLVGAEGRKTVVRVPAEYCPGSQLTLVKLFGGAWHVSSNVPLVFE